MRIGIDVDDTLFDFVGVWIAEYNKEHNDQLTLDDITDWVFSKVDFKCSKPEFYNYLHNAYLQLLAKPFEGAVETLKRLSDRGDLPCFITATRRSVAPTKINKLLMELGPEMPYELHFTSEKWHVACDAYIDDNPKDIETYMKLPGYHLVMLFDRPWNQHVDTHSTVWFVANGRRANWLRLEKPIRVRNWDDIEAMTDVYTWRATDGE